MTEKIINFITFSVIIIIVITGVLNYSQLCMSKEILSKLEKMENQNDR